MDPRSFGPSGWIFFHRFPYLFPNEILSKKEAIIALRFIIFFIDLLPCENCKNNSKMILKDYPIWNNITKKLNGKYIITRYNLFKWTHEFHNRVNRDIGNNENINLWKYEDNLLKHQYENSIFMFLFSICQVYYKTEELKYKIFFNNIIPSLIPKFSLLLESIPLTNGCFIKKNYLLRWLYDIYLIFFKKDVIDTWTFGDLSLLLDAFTSKNNTCQIKCSI